VDDVMDEHQAQRQAQRILDLLAGAQQVDYIGEDVSQLEHALQCAYFASAAHAPAEEVLAALLHDIGHYCGPADAEQLGGLGVAHHEDIAATYLLAAGFSASVASLVRGHVEAKRYLVARTHGYYEKLSSASKQTLALQGGPMSQDEVARFERDPLFKAKLRLRQWDEQGKDPGFAVPPLSSYREMILRHLAAGTLPTYT
jgi:predicted HD phosphohydrolase